MTDKKQILSLAAKMVETGHPVKWSKSATESINDMVSLKCRFYEKPVGEKLSKSRRNVTRD